MLYVFSLLTGLAVLIERRTQIFLRFAVHASKILFGPVDIDSVDGPSSGSTCPLENIMSFDDVRFLLKIKIRRNLQDRKPACKSLPLRVVAFATKYHPTASCSCDSARRSVHASGYVSQRDRTAFHASISSLVRYAFCVRRGVSAETIRDGIEQNRAVTAYAAICILRSMASITASGFQPSTRSACI